jgi:transposase-like protein
MERNINQPKTLQEAVIYFADPNHALAYMTELRWPDGVVVCPTCGRKDVVFLHNQRKWQCKSTHAKRQFSAKVGTIFEDSPIPLEKWLVVVWMISNCKNGVSSYEIARTIGVTQKSAWFMLHRIRLGLQDKQSGGKLGGGPHSKVEIDETYIGGKARNMHKSKRERLSRDGGMQGGHGKTAVMGILERDGKVKAEVLGHKREKKQMHQIIEDSVMPGTWVMTDEFSNYLGLEKNYTHLVVNHLERYVQGNVHTNGIENFWSLLKRGLGGTYVAVEPFHLFRYVDEQAFRFNTRKDGTRKISDSERFDIAMSQVIGKRLTFAELTGKDGATQCAPF